MSSTLVASAAFPAPATFSGKIKNWVLPLCNFLSKGWEVSILGLLVFIKQKYDLPLYLVGLLSTVFIVCQISISIFAGVIAHRLGSKNVILLSISASGTAWLILCLPANFYALFLAYAFAGLSSGLFEPIGNSLVAKGASAKTRSSAIGNFAAFGDMGRIAMVAMATTLAGFFGVAITCAVLLASTVIALVLALLVNNQRTAGSAEAPVSEAPVKLATLLKNKRFCYATIAGIADSFSSASLYIFIPFLLSAKGMPLDQTGWFNALFFMGYLMGRLALGRLSDRHGGPIILIASKIAMTALILLLIVVPSSIVLLMALIFLLGIFTRGSSPIIRAMVADSMDERISFHSAFGTFSFASRGSTALCRPIFGFLASYAGISAVFYVAATVSLLTLYPAAKYRNC